MRAPRNFWILSLLCSFPQCLSGRRKLSLAGYGKGCICRCVSPFLTIRWVSGEFKDQLAFPGAGSSPLHLPFTEASSMPSSLTLLGSELMMEVESSCNEKYEIVSLWSPCRYLFSLGSWGREHVVGFWLLRMLGPNQISPSQSLFQ